MITKSLMVVLIILLSLTLLPKVLMLGIGFIVGALLTFTWRNKKWKQS